MSHFDTRSANLRDAEAVPCPQGYTEDYGSLASDVSPLSTQGNRVVGDSTGYKLQALCQNVPSTTTDNGTLGLDAEWL